MEPSTSESRWGLGIDDYLPIIEGYFPQRKPSLEQVETSLEIFSRKDDSVTCQVLEDVLLLSRYPEKMLQLAQLPGTTAPYAWDVHMTDHVLRHIQTYVEDHKIFDHYFGYLCVQVLVFSLHIDILVYTSQLENMARLLSEVEALDREAYFYGPFSQAIVSTFIQTGGKWSQSFSWDDAEILNYVFGESRKSLFRVCRQVSGVHGWETLFALMWMRSRSNPTDDLTTTRILYIYDLACRHALATYGKKGSIKIFTNYIVDGIKKDVESAGKSLDVPLPQPIMDPQDSEIYDFQDALLHLLNQSGGNRVDGQAIGMFVTFVSYYQFRSTSLGEQRTELMYVTVFERLWQEIEDERTLSNVAFRVKALTLVDRVFAAIAASFDVMPSIDEEVPTEFGLQVQVFVLRLLSHTDWINLAGRAILLTTLPILDLQDSEKDLEERLGQLEGTILDHLCNYCDFFEDECDDRIIEMFRSGPHTYDRDWQRVYDFVQQAYIMQYPAINNFLLEIQAVWEDLGKALGLSNFRADQCAYVGCKIRALQSIGPLQLCEGCLKNQYCCLECQASDWNNHCLDCRISSQ